MTNLTKLQVTTITEPPYTIQSIHKEGKTGYLLKGMNVFKNEEKRKVCEIYIMDSIAMHIKLRESNNFFELHDESKEVFDFVKKCLRNKELIDTILNAQIRK